MLHRHFQRFVVFGAAILFIAYALATEDQQVAKKPDKDEDSTDDGDEEASSSNVVDVANQAGRFGTWSMAVRQAELLNELEGVGPFTLFAPTDEAFGQLEEKLDELLADNRRLAGVLRRHIVHGTYASQDLSEGTDLKTLAGTDLTVHVSEGRTAVGDGAVVEPDLTASNGVIHGIDKVLLPSNGSPEDSD